MEPLVDSEDEDWTDFGNFGIWTINSIRYRELSLMAYGSCSHIFKVERISSEGDLKNDNGSKLYALKSMRWSSTNFRGEIALSMAKSELAALQAMGLSNVDGDAGLCESLHPSIVRIVTYEWNEKRKAFNILMELYDCNLHKYIDPYDGRGEVNPLDEEMGRKLSWQLLEGIDFLHSKRVIHTDIKPHNLLLDDRHETLKICDFGSAQVLEEDNTEGKISESKGTYYYQPPEYHQGKEMKDPINGFKLDIWCFGLTLLQAVTARFPFNPKQNPVCYSKIVRKCEYEIPESLSQTLQDLISKIMCPNPSTRFSIEQIRMHPWYCTMCNTNK